MPQTPESVDPTLTSQLHLPFSAGLARTAHLKRTYVGNERP